MNHALNTPETSDLNQPVGLALCDMPMINNNHMYREVG